MVVTMSPHVATWPIGATRRRLEPKLDGALTANAPHGGGSEGRWVRTVQSSEGGAMAGSVYKVIDIIGTSETSWEEAAKTAVEEAASHLEDLRVAEVVQLDMHIVENKVVAYRAKVSVSFKYHKDA
jgi:flavin-binding protein dodecin